MARPTFFVWSPALAKLRYIVTALAVMSCVSLAQAQRDRGQAQRDRGSWSGRDLWSSRSSSVSRLLRSEEIRKHLDISDAQYGKITALRDSGVDRPDFGELYRGFRDLNEEQRAARRTEIQKKMEELRAAREKKLFDILLPHQVDRLKQIALQSQMRRSRSGGIVTAVSNALKLNEKQKAALQKAQKEGQEELQKEINRLQEKLNNKILSTLTSAQRNQWKKMVGKQFDFPEQDWRSRFSRGSSRSGLSSSGN